MLQKLGLFVALCVGWILWSGYFKPLLLGLGLASTLICTYLALRMRRADGSAARAFGARNRIEQLLPGELLRLLRAQRHLIEVGLGNIDRFGGPIKYVTHLGAGELVNHAGGVTVEAGRLESRIHPMLDVGRGGITGRAAAVRIPCEELEQFVPVGRRALVE